MAIDKKFLVRSVQKKESLIVAYCAFTNMPLVVCDPETMNDQVWLFDTAEQLQKFAKPYTERKIALKGMKYPNEKFINFFATLFSLGVNELVFVGSSGNQTIGLEELVNRPDYSNMPKERQPIFNASLQLSGLYFMQELARKVPDEQKSEIADLEEEFAVNLMKARYLMPVEFMEGQESTAEKLKQKKYRHPILKNKNEERMQPIFSDPIEFGKFNKENKFQAIAVPFDNLSKFLVSDAQGYLLNPSGMHFMMTRELLDELPERFEL